MKNSVWAVQALDPGQPTDGYAWHREGEQIARLTYSQARRMLEHKRKQGMRARIVEMQR